MPPYCYVMIESVAVGCMWNMRIVGVTLNQTSAYVWQQSVPDDIAIRREARQVPFTSL